MKKPIHALDNASVRRVDQLIEQLKLPENYNLYNQQTFGVCRDRSNPTPCNTECCIAGWLVYNEKPHMYMDLVKSGRFSHIPVTAKTLLHLENGEEIDTSDLFGAYSRWTQPDKVYTKRQRANLAIKRLEFLKIYGK